MALDARPDRNLHCDSRSAAEPNTELAIRDIEDKRPGGGDAFRPPAPGVCVARAATFATKFVVLDEPRKPRATR